MNVENAGKGGCPQRDSAEHEGYAEARRSFNRIWKERDSAQSDLLEKILYKDNFNRAYKRVKKNHGAPGIDGMTVEEALPYLRDHQKEAHRPNLQRKVYSVSGQEGGNPEAGRGYPETWDTHGDFILHTSQRCFLKLTSVTRQILLSVLFFDIFKI